jgi:hypothetical protein
MNKFTLLIALVLTFYGCAMSQEKLEKDVSCYVIVFEEPFVKKEIDKVYVPVFQLLDICPKRKKGLQYQGAKIVITRNGKKMSVSFDPIKTFADKTEAKAFQQKFGVADESMLLNDAPKCKLIRVIDMPLRKKNDKETTPTICLLDVCLPPEANNYQHPVITFIENGKKVTRIFEVVRTFENIAKAEKYAKENAVIDYNFKYESELGKIDAELTHAFQDSMRGEFEIEFLNKFKKMLREKLQNPITFENNLINLADKVSIQTSPDKRLKFYSWDTMSGGTAHQMAVFAQFRDDKGKIVVQEIKQDSAENLDFTDFIINRIYEIKVNNQTKYLTFGWGTHGGGEQFNIVQIFQISNGTLKKDNSILPANTDLAITYPRTEQSDLTFNPETNEISYREFVEDKDSGFMKSTGQIITLKLINGKFIRK